MCAVCEHPMRPSLMLIISVLGISSLLMIFNYNINDYN